MSVASKISPVSEINGVEIVKIAHAMKRYGGSFASHIANAAFVADSGNLRKLVEAFPDLFEKYSHPIWLK